MKKTYINPTINVVNISTTQMIAASIDIDGTPLSGDNAVSRELDDDLHLFDDEF